MTRVTRWRAAALVLAAAATACSDPGPIHPEAQYLLADGTEETVDVAPVAVYKASGPAPGSTSVWIGPEGGRIRLLDFEVVVPVGAVPAPMRFRIKISGDPKKQNRALAEFEPHGYPFRQPVTIRLPYQGTTAEGDTPSIIWWDGASWIRYATTLLPDGRLETSTDHFSTFGTEDDRQDRGVTPVGG